ncbi:phytanoyl-CoA dioxygenase family protein [Jannaschia sp. LMIT008]|uniref:phytanoyl-CoA dioxygenase family protein n=1 Tax=Jannaschia maritima TaxID=3032585 RepID=UPI0028115164|nr:phytanoyl-CoA dioxygenase family protein [Jannaschia sp. LMIT008]
MDIASRIADRRRAVWWDTSPRDAAAFETLVTTPVTAGDWPLATEVALGRIPVYEGDAIPTREEARADMAAEWATAFLTGPGIVVIRGAAERAVVDAASDVFDRIIDAERAAGTGGGDHFAKPGANDRVWNAVQKHAFTDPANFARYYACDALALASLAWLGPGYQVTAQVNRVNPGGAAQVPHRDYHLGFMDAAQAARWPAQAHALSPALTLQGAIAHCDMDAAMGPTMLLPHSQKVPEGYLAFHDPAFRDVFARHHVQIPMRMGDAVFFNPAVMHGAGTNRTSDRRRMVNLFQVSSAFGRAIESVDRTAIAKAVFPALSELSADLGRSGTENVICAASEGYPFPTNLDRNPPRDGMAPPSPRDVMRLALSEDWGADRFAGALDRMAEADRP